MADVKWIKLSVNMFDDEKIKLIKTMPEGDKIIVIWVQLLTMAGKTNDGGLVYMGQNMAYTDEMLATLFDEKVNNIRIALKTLEQFGMIEIDGTGKISVVNWEKHQNVEGMQRIKEGNSERQKKMYWGKKLKEIGIDPDSEEVPEDGEGRKEFYNLTKTSRENNVRLTDQKKKKKEEEDKEEDKEKTVVVENNKNTTATVNYSDLNNFYQQNIGVISPYIADDLEMWMEDIGGEMVLEALKKSVEGQKPYRYAVGIMRNWTKNNIKTIDDVRAEEVAFQNKSKQKNPYSRPIKQEDLPDWAKDDAQVIEEKQVNEKDMQEFKTKIKALREKQEALND